MKKIILCGRADVGKTTTIKELIKSLKSKGAEDLWHSYANGETVDYSIILEYNSKILFITTFGDYASQIRANYESMLQEADRQNISADVFISAAHFYNIAMDLFLDLGDFDPFDETTYPIIVLKPDVKLEQQEELIQRKAKQIEDMI